MIFVDTNVFIYAVGRTHPLREPARTFFEESLDVEVPLVTSAEVLQELLHVYLPARRFETLSAAWALAQGVTTIWSVDPEDVEMAYFMRPRHPDLQARDLIHLACCKRRTVSDLKTYDDALQKAWAV